MISTEIQTCKVRPHIHFLPQPPHSENAFIWPYAVKIPRCGGSCSARREILQCRGMDKFNISVPSYKVSYHSSRKRREVMDEFAKLKGIMGVLEGSSMSQSLPPHLTTMDLKDKFWEHETSPRRDNHVSIETSSKVFVWLLA